MKVLCHVGRIFASFVVASRTSSASLAALAEKKRNLRISSCTTETEFVKICSDKMVSDPDGDNIASQVEFVAFLNVLSCQEDGTHESCSGTFDVSPRNFYALPLIIQFNFVKAVCAQLTEKGADSDDCEENVKKVRFTGEKFGLILNETEGELQSIVESFCDSITEEVFQDNILTPCFANPSASPTQKIVFKIGPNDGIPAMMPTMPPSQQHQPQMTDPQNDLDAVFETPPSRGALLYILIAVGVGLLGYMVVFVVTKKRANVAERSNQSSDSFHSVRVEGEQASSVLDVHINESTVKYSVDSDTKKAGDQFVIRNTATSS